MEPCVLLLRGVRVEGVGQTEDYDERGHHRSETEVRGQGSRSVWVHLHVEDCRDRFPDPNPT